MAPYGITANCLCPGMTKTEMLLKSAKEHNLNLDALIKRIPGGRLAKSEDHGGLVSYLASEVASHVTGQVISVDGAQSQFMPLQ
ncbi:Diacetyl reductase [(S)-acetoin forming] [subsurface metagenome]